MADAPIVLNRRVVTDPALIQSLNARMEAAKQGTPAPQQTAPADFSNLLAPSNLPIVGQQQPQYAPEIREGGEAAWAAPFVPTRETTGTPLDELPAVDDQNLIDELQEAPHTQDSWWEDPEMVAMSVLDGLLFGWSDEIASASLAAAAKLTGSQQSYSDLRRAYYQDFERDRQQYNEEHPYASFALNALGAVVTPVGLTGRLAPTAVSGAFRITNNMTTAQKLTRLAGQGAIEGVVAGAGYAGEGRRAEGAALGGLIGVSVPVGLTALGKGFGAVTNRRIKQDLEENGVFKPIVIAANREQPLEGLVSNVYSTIIGKAYGGATIMRQQVARWTDPLVRELDEARAAVVNLKNSAKATVAQAKLNGRRAQQDLRASFKPQTQASEGRIRAEYKQQQRILEQSNRANLTQKLIEDRNDLERAFRSRALLEAVPEGATKAEIEVALKAPNLNSAFNQISQLWNKYGYSMIKERSFRVNKEAVLDTLEKELGSLSGIVGQNAFNVQGLIVQYLERFVGQGGWIKGTDLSSLRSELGQVIGRTEDIYVANVLSGLQDVLNDVVEKQLSGRALDAFRAQNNQWRVNRILGDAINSASTTAGRRGAFSLDQWLRAANKNSSFASKRGQNVLQEEANAVAGAVDTSSRAITEAADAELTIQLNQIQNDMEQALSQARSDIARRQAQQRVLLRRAEDDAIAEAEAANNALAIEQAQRKVELLTENLNRIKGAAPREGATVFERSFALAMVQQYGLLSLGGYLFGLPGTLAAVGATRGLMSEAAQRLIAGQTRWQKALNDLAEQSGFVSARAAGGRALAPTTAGELTAPEGFSRETIELFKRANQVGKANIFRGLRAANREESLRLADEELYNAMLRAYERRFGQ